MYAALISFKLLVAAIFAQAGAPALPPLVPSSHDLPTSASTGPAVQAASDVTSGTMTALRTLEQFHKGVKTVHATFHQVRVDEVFFDKIESDGQLWFRKPGMFRADYADPQPMKTVILEAAIYMYVPELKQVDFWAFESAAAREQQLHQLTIGFGVNAAELSRTYKIRSSEDDAALREALVAEKVDPAKTVMFHFTPREQFAEASPFKELRLTVDKASHLPQVIWYRDPNDAQMTLTLSKIETDAPIADEIYDINKLFPAGVEFVDRRRTQ